MRVRSLWVVVLAVFAMIGTASAGTITAFLYADTAPNIFGSPDWAPWWNQAKADAAAGTFVNMRSGAHAGTTYYEPKELIVYSTQILGPGDFGRRLHWIYWVPGKTIAQLKDCSFEVNMMWKWQGVDYVYNWGTLVPEPANLSGGLPTNGWIEPGTWIDYDKDGDNNPDGVIGTFGNAFWATDNEALPYSTDGDLYNETDLDDVNALAAVVLRENPYQIGYIRWKCEGDSDWNYNRLQLNVVPEPGTMLLWLSGFAAPAMVLLRRRK